MNCTSKPTLCVETKRLLCLLQPHPEEGIRTNMKQPTIYSLWISQPNNPKGCGNLFWVNQMPKQNNSITSTYYVHNQILQHLKTSKRSVPGPRKHFIISWVYKPKVPNTNLLEPRKQWSMKIFILKQNTREPDH